MGHPQSFLPLPLLPAGLPASIAADAAVLEPQAVTQEGCLVNCKTFHKRQRRGNLAVCVCLCV